MDRAWESASKDFNRYIQRLRRLHTGNSVHYLRTVEAHEDSYPHWHAILQFHTPISVNNARYFDTILYHKWKQLWTLGLSDYQPPLSRRLPILYVIKYITKSSHTHKTVWKKILVNVTATSDGNGPPPAHTATGDTTHLLQEFCKKYKIKQCTWSRGFVFPTIPMARRPETGQKTLFTQRSK